MIALFERPCTRHRRVLVESLEGRWDQATPEALAHLDRCGACERELSMTALTLAGLRRLAAEAERVDPPATGWGIVRSRIERPAATGWSWALGIGKATLSVGMLIAIIAPLWMTRPETTIEEAVPTMDTAVRSVRVVRPARAPATTQRAAVVIPAARVEPAPVYEKGPRTFMHQPPAAPKQQPSTVRIRPAPAPTARAR